MAALNKCEFIGYLGQDPEKRVTPAGHSVVNINLGVTERYKDQSGQKQQSTEWIRVIAWNNLAEIIDRYCKKGSHVYVEGKHKTREWQDKDGNKRFSTDIVARNIQLLDPKPSSGYQQVTDEHYNQEEPPDWIYAENNSP